MPDIKYIIDNIVILLLYYIPGYLFFSIYRLCFERRQFSDGINQINSIIFSVVVVSAFTILFPSTKDIVKIVSVSLFSVVLGIIWTLLTNSNVFSNVYSNLFHRTFHYDFWRDSFDTEGTALRIYRNDTIIIGLLHRIEEEGSDRWLMLSEYSVLDKNENIIMSGENHQELAIKVTTDDLVRFSYGENSPFLQK